MPRTKAWARGLYVITDPRLIPPPAWPQAVAAAIAGGAVMVQYRDKTATATERRQRAQQLLAVCHAQGVPLIINDDIELAHSLGANGVHLGREDADCRKARDRLGPDAIIGISCYNQRARALEAQAAGASYVAFGRFYASQTKPQAVPAEVDVLRRARRELHIPIAAIGGINAGNAAELIAAGADLVAVIQGVFGQPDITAAARAIANLFEAKKAKS